MTLETLKGVTKIGGFDVAELTKFADRRPDEYIVVNHENNGISFIIQSDPVSLVGVDGCQANALIDAARLIYTKLNAKFPCRETSMMITKLDEALMWDKKRTEDRTVRGVEGEAKA